MIDFSPNERFMVTLSQKPESRASNNPVCDMIVWDICKETVCRNFSGAISSWPAFKWSHDDAYVATVQGGKIYVYGTEDFSLVDGKPIIAPVPINNFEFSPTENILAFWTQETNSTPSRVALISIPSRKELCTKNLFQVASIILDWHPQGDYLCIQVERYNKKKMEEGHIKYLGTFINLEIVRLREKLFPIDQITVKDATSLTNFAWEPTGNRFAYIAVDNANKNTIPLYSLTKSGKVAELATFERPNTRINCLKWSPKGNIFVVANLNAADASLEFIDANDCQALSKVDHPMAGEIHWDGTGRYVASVVTSFRQKSDNGVWFWNSVGSSLYQKKMTGLQLFAWRPFPPSLLSPEQINKIKKDLGTKYSPQFDVEDKMLASKASRDVMERRQTLTSKFNAWRTNLLSRYSADKAKRDKLRGTDTDRHNLEEVEEEVEFLVKTSREKVKREA
nr:eukaryotic translation initiation factor 3 [Hymenolepis microstoma]